MIVTRELHVRARDGYDVQDITDAVARAVKESKLAAGIVTIFCPGSTGGLTTIEYESGVVADLRQVLDEITPPDRDYRHHARWHDDNGHSHVRASLVGPSLSIPVAGGQPVLGTWQQVVMIDFDTRPRTRTVVVQVVPC